MQMSTKKIGYALIALGIFGVTGSTILDFIGLGEGGIQAAQILGILTGMIILAFGVALALLSPEKQFRLTESLRAVFEHLLALPVSVWVVVGFLVAFILFYLLPVFLNSEHTMVYFNRYIPNRYPIGLDLELTTGNVFSWVTTRQSPYPEQIYPPLTYILLAPFTLLKYPLNFAVATYLTFFAYVILTALIPIMFGSKKHYSMVMLFFIAGLFSYGFQFELERGQYYTVTFLLCMISIYLFHKHRQLRYFAYLLFSISVQLKIIPVYLIFMFVEDWRDWKSNIKRMIGFFLFNFALLFVLGYRAFLGFLEAILNYMRSPLSQWNGNHSVKNFVFTFSQDGFGLVSQNTLEWLQNNATLIERFLMLIIAACILGIIIRAYRTKEIGFNPYLLLACTLIASTIPVSVDYTLPILIAPMAIFFSTITLPNGAVIKRLLSILLIVVMSLSYASTLYPFKYKAYYLNNMFPPLFIVLIAVTLLYFLRGRESDQIATGSEPANMEKAIA
jgi:Glycosyltransferase family 87